MSNPFPGLASAAAALWASVVRTVVPYIVGAVGSFFATANLPVDPEFEVALGVLLTLIFGAVWYILVRLLETYVAPKLGWLIGLAKKPEYISPPK